MDTGFSLQDVLEYQKNNNIVVYYFFILQYEL